MAILELQSLTIGYQGRDKHIVAKDLNLSLQVGELVCLIGPNGAGKSTLLRTLAGMQQPLGGAVKLGDRLLHKLKPNELARRLSIVLTEPIDVGLLTGYELVTLGRHPYTDWTGQLTKVDEDVVLWAIESVDAKLLAPRQVRTLSDGERQKLMIARALAQEPHVMILDEPTAFLDLPRRVEMIQTLRHIAHARQRAVLLSTHDLDLALKTADRIWLMSKKGQILAGTPEDLVMNGAFETVFHSEGVHFDANTGSFKLVRPLDKFATVTGTGLRAFWTRRALERLGFDVRPDASLKVTVSDDAWQISWADESKIVTSIEALVQVLDDVLTDVALAK